MCVSVCVRNISACVRVCLRACVFVIAEKDDDEGSLFTYMHGYPRPVFFDVGGKRKIKPYGEGELKEICKNSKEEKNIALVN